ncbi:MAG: aminoglycoside phosphotransferase family protein [Chlamydiales bacterium]|nr:aminoglycoside phosphotransferase family protein [Chlamydiales bacterium]
MDNLTEVYRDCLDLNRAVFSRIDHNDTMVAVVYRVDQPAEKSLILKICTRDKDFHRELYFLNALAGVLPIPKVEKVVEPIGGRAGAILMECLEGSLLTESDWSNELANEVGTNLALLHSKRADVYGDVTQSESYAKNARDYFKDKFFEELNECANHLPKETISSCVDYWESHQNLLEGVDGPCIVHRDFRPGNMIVYNGKLVGVIDWASARFGFAEQDFCSMEHRSWPKNSKHKQALLAGYSTIRKLPNHNAVMPLLRLGRALAVIGFTVSSGTWEGKDKEIYQYNRKFLDGFFA